MLDKRTVDPLSAYLYQCPDVDGLVNSLAPEETESVNRIRPAFAPLIRLVGALVLVAAASNCNDFGGATRITQPIENGGQRADAGAAPTVAIIAPANGATASIRCSAW